MDIVDAPMGTAFHLRRKLGLFLSMEKSHRCRCLPQQCQPLHESASDGGGDGGHASRGASRVLSASRASRHRGRGAKHPCRAGRAPKIRRDHGAPSMTSTRRSRWKASRRCDDLQSLRVIKMRARQHK